MPEQQDPLLRSNSEACARQGEPQIDFLDASSTTAAMTRQDETWHRLREWTYGQTPSERLAGQILDSEGYGDIDPSHPLGGKDGGRDFHITRNGEPWIAGVYFPRDQQTITTITNKFKADLEAAKKYAPKGFAFVTNQELLLSQREDLKELGGGIAIELYHLERIMGILDRPRMHPVRKHYLGIDPGPLPIEVELSIGGSAGYFTDSAEVLETHLDYGTRKAREDAEEQPENSDAYLELKLSTLNNVYRKQPRPTGDRLEKHLQRWEAEVRTSWPDCLDYLAATVGPALSFRVKNLSGGFFNDVQVYITINGVRGIDSRSAEHFDIARVLPPVFPTASGYLIDASLLQAARPKGYAIHWESDDDTVTVTIDIERFRPHPPWKNQLDDVVLVLVDKSLTEVTASWTVTAQGYNVVYEGPPITIPIEAKTVREAIGPFLQQ
ncbi:hypothetical protein LTV02_35245 [Nocardia yamanashiensis]|uniref:hypothetical protein n=1 Tax=Nocardia yamanashiensis TaxID=209247 RepID=UPI001E62BFC2|nr:hypothetical protein [Nocardia yamanashiensis]UGT41149.1 hypothetical protein LTV02_35245 [Nocardia yamanashiensis]